MIISFYSSYIKLSICTYRYPLRDNREATYKQTLQAAIVPNQTQLVFVIIGGAKSTYDAIKKFCCIDVPGMQDLFSFDSISAWVVPV